MALRWGILSAGLISNDFVRAMKLLPETDHIPYAVAARNKDRAVEFAKKFNIPKAYGSYEELAQDPDVDVVYVSPINSEHHPAALMCLRHGKHVLCEKPMTTTVEHTTELVNEARKHGKFLMEGFWSRCFPVYRKLDELLKAEAIGDIKMITVAFAKNFDVPNDNPSVLPQYGGGAVLMMGCYAMMFASMVSGGTVPEELKAVGNFTDTGVDDTCTISARYGPNLFASVSISLSVKFDNSATIYGTKGMIRIPAFWAPAEIWLNDEKLPGIPTLPPTDGYNFENSSGLIYEMQHIRDCLKKGLTESPWMPLDESITIARVEAEVLKQIS